MKFVVYLSGRDDATLAWHRAHDSVAASVVVPRSLVEQVTRDLVESEIIESEPPRSYKGSDVPLRMSPSALSDLFSDLGEDAEDGSELDFLANEVQLLCECEALCGDIHLIIGRA